MMVLNVSTPFPLPELQSSIQKANFISVMTDASNHKDTIRIFQVLRRYFEPSKGFKLKVLEVKSFPGERGEIVSEFLTDSLSSIRKR
jgi:hypothetical protein